MPRQPDRRHAVSSRRRRLPLAALAAAFVASVLGGCSRNAATGEMRLMMLPMEREIAMGEEAAPQFIEEFGGRVASPSLQEYVTEIGRRMAARTEGDFPSLQWEFILLDSGVVNAFALPGGKVFITRGLAERLEDESELAGVLGHEIGHVTAQHANSRISKQLLLSGGLQAISAVLAGAPAGDRAADVGRATLPALEVGGELMMLRFSRGEEIEADELGMRYMSRVGYDPSGQLRVMQLLGELAGGEQGFDWFATHPDPAERARRIEQLLATRYADVALEGDGRFATRFRSRFLVPVGKLAPPRHAADAAGSAGGLLASGFGWCGTCREHHASAG
jgi:predicted Zn-dependent protease